MFAIHTDQYLWVTTVAYLHGVIPVVMLMLMLALSVGTVALSWVVHLAGSRHEKSVYISSTGSWRKWVMRVMLLLGIHVVHTGCHIVSQCWICVGTAE